LLDILLDQPGVFAQTVFFKSIGRQAARSFELQPA
jgi:hypothetical protein